MPSHLPLRTEACFGKTYDAEHLRQNPKQRVTRFHLFRDFTVDKTAESPPLSASEFLERDGEGGHVGLMAYVGFRDKPGVFTQLARLSQEQRRHRRALRRRMRRWRLQDRRQGDKALLVENEGFVVTGGCGANEDDQERRDFVAPGESDRQGSCSIRCRLINAPRSETR